MSTHVDESRDDTGEEEIYRRLADMEVTLYHGTRQSLATAILRDGFQPPPLAEQVAAVARAYAVPLDTLVAHLRGRGAYSFTDGDRAGTVSMSPDRARAAKYAERAPEVVRDALWSVYALTHGEIGARFEESEEGEFWVMAQQLANAPAVIEARARVGALQLWGHSAGEPAMELLRRLNARQWSAEDFTRRFTMMPEWRARVEDVRAVAVHPAPTRILLGQLAFMSEQPITALFEQDREGRWGVSGNPGRSGSESPWWPFEEVWPRLTPARRAQLEDFAGRSLS
ncbi:Uncharacterised protein [Mycobacteroides abscessus subsp. abscessus]|uniref:hypothetical protein n=1 Tax=Mycobacteroides abscessus TaxID=36809 RepID=UPI0009276B11|nr:hypothetical protein [Mycobacteroides abscessus]SHX66841.1 Uncharacterised protein [Mycobacteroides abscessus subsp. abscessus]SIC59719.1 Uncharacterised protein [Mycobacteroides abscessus subsp. abscessus]SKK20450.1 Uncharacterised protein [Mycobacteroides abscessus subsp. abscessus]SKP50209.1 Uncharacterised protein [Mycobacteroides abscessus subsp. abscessus]SKR41885.1 Uncharacterised protein [Mycobacteroides abscessus subsp. abscessus]